MRFLSIPDHNLKKLAASGGSFSTSSGGAVIQPSTSSGVVNIAFGVDGADLRVRCNSERPEWKNRNSGGTLRIAARGVKDDPAATAE